MIAALLDAVAAHAVATVAPPTLAAAYVAGSGGPNTSVLTTAAFTPAVGEVLVVKGLTWDGTHHFTGVPTASGGGSPAFTLRASTLIANTSAVFAGPGWVPATPN